MSEDPVKLIQILLSTSKAVSKFSIDSLKSYSWDSIFEKDRDSDPILSLFKMVITNLQKQIKENNPEIMERYGSFAYENISDLGILYQLIKANFKRETLGNLINSLKPGVIAQLDKLAKEKSQYLFKSNPNQLYYPIANSKDYIVYNEKTGSFYISSQIPDQQKQPIVAQKQQQQPIVAQKQQPIFITQSIKASKQEITTKISNPKQKVDVINIDSDNDDENPLDVSLIDESVQDKKLKSDVLKFYNDFGKFNICDHFTFRWTKNECWFDSLFFLLFTVLERWTAEKILLPVLQPRTFSKENGPYSCVENEIPKDDTMKRRTIQNVIRELYIQSRQSFDPKIKSTAKKTGLAISCFKLRETLVNECRNRIGSNETPEIVPVYKKGKKVGTEKIAPQTGNTLDLFNELCNIFDIFPFQNDLTGTKSTNVLYIASTSQHKGTIKSGNAMGFINEGEIYSWLKTYTEKYNQFNGPLLVITGPTFDFFEDAKEKKPGFPETLDLRRVVDKKMIKYEDPNLQLVGFTIFSHSGAHYMAIACCEDHETGAKKWFLVDDVTSTIYDPQDSLLDVLKFTRKRQGSNWGIAQAFYVDPNWKNPKFKFFKAPEIKPEQQKYENYKYKLKNLQSYYSAIVATIQKIILPLIQDGDVSFIELNDNLLSIKGDFKPTSFTKWKESEDTKIKMIRDNILNIVKEFYVYSLDLSKKDKSTLQYAVAGMNKL